MVPTVTDNIFNNAAVPTHQTEKELDDLFLSAFDDFDGVDSRIGEACSNKSVSKVVQNMEPTSAPSNASHTAKAIRKFAQPVSNKDIAKTMLSAIPTKTHRDNKYCYTLWNDWVLYRANSTGEVYYTI